MTPAKLQSMNVDYEPEKTFPDFLFPRPTKLTQEETSMVRYYKNLQRKILEETPFCINWRKQQVDKDDDGGKETMRQF